MAKISKLVLEVKSAQILMEISQHEMASLLNITRSALSSYYSGRNRLPHRVYMRYKEVVPDSIQRLAREHVALKKDA